MRVFRDLRFVEQLGTGIQRVLKSYDKSIFNFFPNHIRVSIPFNENQFKQETSKLKYESCIFLNQLQKSIVKLIMDRPNITQDELARLLDVNKRTIIRNFKVLIDNKYIERIGANKNGYWKITDKLLEEQL